MADIAAVIDAARTLSHRRCGTSLPWAAAPHTLQVAQKATTGMRIISSQTAARKLGGCGSEHQIENLDNFPRIKLLAYFEDEPLYPLRTASARYWRVCSAKPRLSVLSC